MKKSQNETLHELFLTKLQSLLDIENQITQALPKLVKKASSPMLKEAFSEHLEETRAQANKLTQIFESLGERPTKLKSEGIRGITADAEWVMQNISSPESLDAALIAAAQYVEHYEIAGYGTAKEWAKLMGHNKEAEILNEILQEEKAANKKLNQLAIKEINKKVKSGIEL
ncbi:MAG: ferritin-like domain-containing protein [Candidatus Doudnabacteria bacterium]|nr:ferritin-like domain-containing protein [Candidatus Doudnabacteria bacterium]